MFFSINLFDLSVFPGANLFLLAKAEHDALKMNLLFSFDKMELSAITKSSG